MLAYVLLLVVSTQREGTVTALGDDQSEEESRSCDDGESLVLDGRPWAGNGYNFFQVYHASAVANWKGTHPNTLPIVSWNKRLADEVVASEFLSVYRASDCQQVYTYKWKVPVWGWTSALRDTMGYIMRSLAVGWALVLRPADRWTNVLKYPALMANRTCTGLVMSAPPRQDRYGMATGYLSTQYPSRAHFYSTNNNQETQSRIKLPCIQTLLRRGLVNRVNETKLQQLPPAIAYQLKVGIVRTLITSALFHPNQPLEQAVDRLDQQIKQSQRHDGPMVCMHIRRDDKAEEDLYFQATGDYLPLTVYFAALSRLEHARKHRRHLRWQQRGGGRERMAKPATIATHQAHQIHTLLEQIRQPISRNLVHCS